MSDCPRCGTHDSLSESRGFCRVVGCGYGTVTSVSVNPATALAPGNARFAYVYAVALHSTGRSDAAIARLEKTLLAHPNDRDILEALASFHQARGDNGSAKKFAERLRAVDEKVTISK